MTDGMHPAAFNGHAQVVHHLLAEHVSSINIADSTASYPLMWASRNGHLEVVQMLLEGGADVNAQDGDYGNAL
jgi:ankyrin repeat protein